MNTNCKNCDNTLTGKYCDQCGQAANTHKINAHFLWHDIQHSLLHVDKGLIFTSKELFTRPGHTIKEFINGKRVKHFRPVSLVLILAGIYGFLYHYFHLNAIASNVNIIGNDKTSMNLKSALLEVNEWFGQHYALVSLVQIPIYAVGSYFAFKKWKYNYVEHLVINAFTTGQRLLIHLISFPLLYIFMNGAAFKGIMTFVNFSGFVLMVWTFIQFFDQHNKLSIILRSLLTMVIFFAIFLSLATLAIFITWRVY